MKDAVMLTVVFVLCKTLDDSIIHVCGRVNLFNDCFPASPRLRRDRLRE